MNLQGSSNLPIQNQELGVGTLQAEKGQSSWICGFAKGFSDAFAGFTARFKSQPKHASNEDAIPKSMFTSLRDWVGSFSLRSWISKGISFSFGIASDKESVSSKTYFVGSLLSWFSGGTKKEDAQATLRRSSMWEKVSESDFQITPFNAGKLFREKED